MVVLQLTGMDSVAGLENNREYLREVVALNCTKHENDEWCLRAKEFSQRYEKSQKEKSQKKKFFQDAISDGWITFPSEFQQIIRPLSTTKEWMKNGDSEFAAIRSHMASSQWRFNTAAIAVCLLNTATAVGLVVSGILLFRKPIR